MVLCTLPSILVTPGPQLLTSHFACGWLQSKYSARWGAHAQAAYTTQLESNSKWFTTVNTIVRLLSAAVVASNSLLVTRIAFMLPAGQQLALIPGVEP